VFRVLFRIFFHFLTTSRAYNKLLDFWDAIAFCLEDGGRLISPEHASLVDTDDEISQLMAGMYRTRCPF
jgi:hypothetical protein